MERACLGAVVTGNVTVIDFASSARGWESNGEEMPVCMQ
jgi:hypothetical protein